MPTKKQIIIFLLHGFACCTLAVTENQCVNCEQNISSQNKNWKTQMDVAKISYGDINASKGFGISDVMQKINEQNATIKKYNLNNLSKIENNSTTSEAVRIKQGVDNGTMSVNKEEMQKYILQNKDYIFKTDKNDPFASKQTNKNATYEFDNKQNSTNEFLLPAEKIYVVVSSSMPESTIGNLVKSAYLCQKDIAFVMRGFIGGMSSSRPTIEYINKIIDGGKAGSNFEINSNIVKKLNITSVPAVVYIKNINILEQQPNNANNYEIVYGAVSLKYALEKINDKVASKSLKRLVDAVR